MNYQSQESSNKTHQNNNLAQLADYIRSQNHRPPLQGVIRASSNQTKGNIKWKKQEKSKLITVSGQLLSVNSMELLRTLKQALIPKGQRLQLNAPAKHVNHLRTYRSIKAGDLSLVLIRIHIFMVPCHVYEQVLLTIVRVWSMVRSYAVFDLANVRYLFSTCLRHHYQVWIGTWHVLLIHLRVCR